MNKNMMKKSLLTIFISALFFTLNPAYEAVAIQSGDHPYVGSGGCACHRDELNDWQRSKHGNAFNLLKPGARKSAKKKAGLDPEKDYTNDKKCVKCHVVGYEKSGGFKDADSTSTMAGVGCEMCHGAGGSYRKLHKSKSLTFTKEEVIQKGQVYATLDQSVCNQCHYQQDTPFKPELDEKYNYNFEVALNNPRLFHEIYPLEGKH